MTERDVFGPDVTFHTEWLPVSLRLADATYPYDSSQVVYKFPNGYGASVIRGPYTYGGREGLFELAMLKGDDICYRTPITSDVLASLTTQEVGATINAIAALPSVVPPCYCQPPCLPDTSCQPGQ